MMRDLEARDNGELAPYLLESGEDELDSSRTAESKGHKRKKRKIRLDELSTRWPLASEELPPALVSLDEAILSFAASYIRSRRLRLPGQTPPSMTHDEDFTLPPNLVSSTEEFINETLVGMAGMRPVNVAKTRKAMGRIGWAGVLGAASMMCQHRQ